MAVPSLDPRPVGADGPRTVPGRPAPAGPEPPPPGGRTVSGPRHPRAPRVAVVRDARSDGAGWGATGSGWRPFRAGHGGVVARVVAVLVFALLLAVGVRTYVAQMFFIPSGSMLPPSRSATASWWTS